MTANLTRGSATDAGGSGGLRVIFSIFLGLIVATFFGVGVYTFHPPPRGIDAELRELSRQEQALLDPRMGGEPTAEERAALLELSQRRNELMDRAQAEREPWGRSTSILLVSLATLAMAVSLVRADRLPVVSNGLLLGGVFTMLYGVGWIVATDTAISRFLVVTVALVITLALGYVRFVRGGTGPPASTGDAAPAGTVTEGDGLQDLERRVARLEGRLSQAANALAEYRPRETGGPRPGE